MDLLDVLEVIAVVVFMLFIFSLLIFVSDPWDDEDNYYHRF